MELTGHHERPLAIVPQRVTTMAALECLKCHHPRATYRVVREASHLISTPSGHRRRGDGIGTRMQEAPQVGRLAESNDCEL